MNGLSGRMQPLLAIPARFWMFFSLSFSCQIFVAGHKDSSLSLCNPAIVLQLVHWIVQNQICIMAIKILRMYHNTTVILRKNDSVCDLYHSAEVRLCDTTIPIAVLTLVMIV